MPRKLPLPDHLSPEQMIDLFDALLSNADSLLNAASAVNQQGSPGLARSLAILGLEESGKAIALFDRRIHIAYEDEGVPFVDDALQKIWSSHREKLTLVHQFLVDEHYWFGEQPPAPHELLTQPMPGDDLDAVVESYRNTVVKTIEKWAVDDNLLKQAGFYVDVDPETGAITTPKDYDGQRVVEEVIAQVHQIGWQLRLGEHIEAKSQAEAAEDHGPPLDSDLDAMRAMGEAAGLPPVEIEQLVESARTPDPPVELHNAGYRLHLDPDPLSKLGKPGYEAQTRELFDLYNRGRGDDSQGDENAST